MLYGLEMNSFALTLKDVYVTHNVKFYWMRCMSLDKIIALVNG